MHDQRVEEDPRPLCVAEERSPNGTTRSTRGARPKMYRQTSVTGSRSTIIGSATSRWVLPHPWVLLGKERKSSWCKPRHRHKEEEKVGRLLGHRTLKQLTVKKHLLELLMASDADWLPHDSRESAVLGFALGTSWKATGFRGLASGAQDSVQCLPRDPQGVQMNLKGPRTPSVRKSWRGNRGVWAELNSHERRRPAADGERYPTKEDETEEHLAPLVDIGHPYHSQPLLEWADR